MLSLKILSEKVTIISVLILSFGCLCRLNSLKVGTKEEKADLLFKKEADFTGFHFMFIAEKKIRNNFKRIYYFIN